MQNWLMCAELKRHRNRKILHILYSNIALSSAMTAATFSAKHFRLKVIRYFAILCINATVTGVGGVTISNCIKFSSYMHSVTSVVCLR